jgi:hypothetical protein
MIMDPRDLRADEAALRGVDPLARAKARMEVGEQVEARAAAEREAVRREQFADALAARDMADRIELFRQGYLTREAEAVRARAEAQRHGKIVELRAELGRLEGHLWRVPAASDVDREAALLEAHRAGAQEWATGACMRMRQASLQAEIRRSQPPPTSRASGGPAGDAGAQVRGARRPDDPPPRRREMPPLSMPEAAHLLPGDW